MVWSYCHMAILPDACAAGTTQLLGREGEGALQDAKQDGDFPAQQGSERRGEPPLVRKTPIQGENATPDRA